MSLLVTNFSSAHISLDREQAPNNKIKHSGSGEARLTSCKNFQVLEKFGIACLENIMERAVISTEGNTLQLELPSVPAPSDHESLQSLATIERAHILRVLKAEHWRIEGPKGPKGRSRSIGAPPPQHTPFQDEKTRHHTS